MIYKLIKAGDLPAEITVPTDRPRQRRRIRLRASDVEAYLERVQFAPAEDSAGAHDLAMKPTGHEWMGDPRAANRLGVGLTTLYRIIDAGGLPAYKFGR